MGITGVRSVDFGVPDLEAAVKFYEEVCLYEQPFIKDQTVNISQLIASKIGKLGENISVRRFARFKVGVARYGKSTSVTLRRRALLLRVCASGGGGCRGGRITGRRIEIYAF